MLGLASSAMTKFGVERLLSAELILDLAAVAASLITSLEVLIRFVDAVGRTLLPVRSGLLTSFSSCFLGIHCFLCDLVTDGTGCLFQCNSRGNTREEGRCGLGVMGRGLNATS